MRLKQTGHRLQVDEGGWSTVQDRAKQAVYIVIIQVHGRQLVRTFTPPSLGRREEI